MTTAGLASSACPTLTALPCRLMKRQVRPAWTCVPQSLRNWCCSPANGRRSRPASSSKYPQGFEGQVRPRSGLALKNGVTCLNSPGTIDWDYRGEVKVILANLGAEPFTITRAMRIAQLVIAPVTRVKIAEIAELSATERGAGGFGSTGTG